QTSTTPRWWWSDVAARKNKSPGARWRAIKQSPAKCGSPKRLIFRIGELANHILPIYLAPHNDDPSLGDAISLPIGGRDSKLMPSWTQVRSQAISEPKLTIEIRDPSYFQRVNSLKAARVDMRHQSHRSRANRAFAAGQAEN